MAVNDDRVLTYCEPGRERNVVDIQYAMEFAQSIREDF
jgi:hypothetical protein